MIELQEIFTSSSFSIMNGGSPIKMVAWILVLVGAINWGLVGVGGLMGDDWNVVSLLLGQWSVVENIVYVLVGLSGLVCIFRK